MYLTFDEYQTMGGALDMTHFTRSEYAARMKIDALTRNRAREFDDVPEPVRMLIFELIERGLLGRLNGKEILSSSNDGNSMTFKDTEGKAEELIREYLAGVETPDGEPLIGASIQFARIVR